MQSLLPGYCIDTSALIDLWRRHYAPDVFKSVWEKIEHLIYNQELISPIEVLKELSKRDDELLNWIKKKDIRKMFKVLDNEQTEWVYEIMRRFPPLVDTLASTPIADPFVVALALSKGYSVITSETTKKGKVKIPDVCRAYNIKCLKLLEFFREKKWIF